MRREKSDQTKRKSFRVQPATAQHIPAIARMHKEEINQGFLAELGDAFLRRLYEAMLRHDETNVLVCLDDEKIVGFVTVTLNTSRMYRWTMRQHWWRFGIPIALRMTKPSRIRRVVENLLYSSQKQSVDLPEAELLSIAVDGGYRRCGIGRLVVSAGLEWLREQNVEKMRVSCTEGLKSNEMFMSIGFERATQMEHHGQQMNIYVCDVRSILTKDNQS